MEMVAKIRRRQGLKGCALIFGCGNRSYLFQIDVFLMNLVGSFNTNGIQGNELVLVSDNYPGVRRFFIFDVVARKIRSFDIQRSGPFFQINFIKALQTDGRSGVELILGSHDKLYTFNDSLNKTSTYDIPRFLVGNVETGWEVDDVYDLNGAGGPELVVQAYSQLVVIDDRAGRSYKYGLPVPHTINNVIDLNNKGGNEIVIQALQKVIVVNHSKRSKKSYDLPSEAYSIEGYYDIDSHPGIEIVLLMPKKVVLIDSVKQKTQILSIPPATYEVNGVYDTDGGPSTRNWYCCRK